MQGRYITERGAIHVLYYRPFLRVSSCGQVCLWYQLKRPDFRDGKSTERKCNKTIVDHITHISSWISHPYNNNIRVQIVLNYIIYYIAALAESKVAFIQNSLKIRSPNLSVGTNPSTVKLVGAILLSRTYVPKFISTICTGHFHPMSFALWKLDASSI
jgi:hypothetical protein